jgi:hypothetical protein
MTAPKPALELLRPEHIHELLRNPGPCLTLRMPPYIPGAQTRPMAAILNTYIQEATRHLGECEVPDSAIVDLLDPLRELGKDPELFEGSHWGRVIFRSPDVFRQFHLTEPAGAGLTIAGCFEIRPILAQLHLPPEFYLLKLSKERVGLLRCTDLRIESVELPRGVPATLEEMLAFEPPDHDLENRSAAGSSVGAMGGVHFGTGSGRETQHTYLADFYKAVDRWLHGLLHDGRAPLVLVGVEEHAAMYHAINTYANLLVQSIHGSPDSFLEEVDLMRRGFAIIRAAGIERAVKELAESRERFAPVRFSTDLDTILRAAVEGRVDRIYIDENARRDGVFQRSAEEKRQTWGSEDLLNLGAVETVLHGGQAFAVPDGTIPDGAALAAVFRF